MNTKIEKISHMDFESLYAYGKGYKEFNVKAISNRHITRLGQLIQAVIDVYEAGASEISSTLKVSMKNGKTYTLRLDTKISQPVTESVLKNLKKLPYKASMFEADVPFVSNKGDYVIKGTAPKSENVKKEVVTKTKKSKNKMSKKESNGVKGDFLGIVYTAMSPFQIAVKLNPNFMVTEIFETSKKAADAILEPVKQINGEVIKSTDKPKYYSIWALPNK